MNSKLCKTSWKTQTVWWESSVTSVKTLLKWRSSISCWVPTTFLCFWFKSLPYWTHCLFFPLTPAHFYGLREGNSWAQSRAQSNIIFTNCQWLIANIEASNIWHGCKYQRRAFRSTFFSKWSASSYYRNGRVIYIHYWQESLAQFYVLSRWRRLLECACGRGITCVC